MSNFLRAELGVAMSGVKWDVAGYKLWQSTDPGIVLFTPKQPKLAMGSNDRYQFGMSLFRQQTDDRGYAITGGSAAFTITSAIQHDAAGFAELQDQWRTEMASSDHPPDRNPRFVSLNVQKGTARVLINPLSGTPDEAHNDINIGTPGGTNSFLLNLTELGAQEWAQGIREGTGIPAAVLMRYEYLRMLPAVGAEVKIRSERMHTAFSAEMKMSGGFLTGSSAQIGAAWERMKRDGHVEVTFIGQGLAPELQDLREELVDTFIDQVQQKIFDALFRPAPEVEPAQAGGGGGLFGGASFAAKFQRSEEITNVEQTIRFEGWTWLRASMDAEVTSLLADLDESYVTEVNTEMAFPATVVVDADPQLETTAISWTASEGAAPRTPVFANDGGVETYTVSSDTPGDVVIDWQAQVNFLPPSWPVIRTSGSDTVSAGGNQVVIKPAAWIGRHMIYLFIRDEQGNVVLDPSSPLLANSRLVANVSYSGPHLPRPINESASIDPAVPLEFSYPLSPEGAAGNASFSAFGAIGGRMVRATALDINLDEEAVFIVASPSSVQLVSENAVFAEAQRDGLIRHLLTHGDRPVIEDRSGHIAMAESARSGGNGRSASEYGRAVDGDRIEGVVTGVEYSRRGSSLVLQTDSGSRLVPLRTLDLAEQFDDTRKRVLIELDPDQFAERIRVLL